MGLARNLGVMCLHCGGQFAWEVLPLAHPSSNDCDLLVVYPELLPTRAGGCLFGGAPVLGGLEGA